MIPFGAKTVDRTNDKQNIGKFNPFLGKCLALQIKNTANPQPQRVRIKDNSIILVTNSVSPPSTPNLVTILREHVIVHSS